MLILGGTFDPPHIGHLVLAESARAELGMERVVLMPAGDPWRKTAPSGDAAVESQQRAVSPARVRLTMVRLAVRDANARGTASRLAVDDREVRRQGPTYTADTLAELRAEGHGDLVLLLGSDALADMPQWHEPGRILELARVAVAPKPGETSLAEALAGIEAAVASAAERVVQLRTVPPLELSSTQVRERVRSRLAISYLVPRPVERYIARNGLYRDSDAAASR